MRWHYNVFALDVEKYTFMSDVAHSCGKRKKYFVNLVVKMFNTSNSTTSVVSIF